jgi:hypothetical protein
MGVDKMGSFSLPERVYYKRGETTSGGTVR